jgi:cyclophilin family peptidyl-prolyl cis-trans isomerase
MAQKDLPQAGESIAIIETNKGTIKARLFADLVPGAVKNFVDLANLDVYSDVPFHRVIPGFMVQGGDFNNKNGTGGYAAAGEGSTIADEYHSDLSHIRGALSYAKTQMPKSIGSQFFIVHPEDGTHFLDHPENGSDHEGYTVFGQVFAGIEAVDEICKIPTNGMDQPLEPCTIEKITIEEYSA